ncbi:MAG TPA: Gfo/Idh/MocA family oxidoreductase, partial [Segetibacter sp.]
FGMSGKVFHGPFLHAHPGFDLYAVFERSKKTASTFYPNIISYNNLEEMLADESVELVVVNTPNSTHYNFARQALQAGKHVIVEKPFVVNSREGEELIELAARNQKILSVYQNRRWDSDFQLVKRVVDEKLLGEIVEAEIHYDRFRVELSPKVHKETIVPGAGLLYDLGPHLIDQALQLFGKPDAVFADLAIFRPLSVVNDYLELLLYYPKRRVRLRASNIVKSAVPAFVLHGIEGTFIKTRADVQEDDLIAGKSVQDDDWGIESESEKGVLTTADGQVKLLAAPKGNYMPYFEGIFKAIRQGISVPVTAAQALENIKIIEAAILSSNEKRIIDL